MKKVLSIIMIATLCFTGCSNESDTTQTAEEIQLSSNQTLVIGQVTEINGNDMVLALAEEKTMEGMSSSKGGFGMKGQSQTSNSSTNQDSSTSNESQQNTSSEQTPPDMSGTTGTTSGQTPPDMSGMSSDSSSHTRPDMNSQSSENSTSNTNTDATDSNKPVQESDSDTETKTTTYYQLTGDQQTVRIPVGTEVTTLLGTATTFSRIAVDDTLKLVMEKNADGDEVVVAVYIVA